MDTALPIDLRLDPYSHGLASGSDDDVFSFFLGPSPTIGRQSAYQKRNVDKFNMPENYVGQNLYLRDTMVRNKREFCECAETNLICYRKIGCSQPIKRGTLSVFCPGV